VQVEFVGHPLAEMERPMTPAAGAGLHLQGTTKPETMIALLPGSRRKEVRMNLPAMIAATYHVRQRSEFVIPVASTLDKAWVEDQAMWYWKPVTDRRVAEGNEAHVLTFSNDARQTLAGARAAIVASGTATVEAAVIGTPFVMVYRVSPVTYVLGKRLVKVPFYAMPNLIAGRQVIPELVQGDFTAERVAAELNKIILDGPEREKMVAGLAEVRAKLRGTDTVGASERAADAVLSVAAGR
jgi:lipid-A-disaccharide synthase